MARTKLITLRVTDEEHEALSAVAKFNNTSVSEYVRAMATSESGKPTMKVTGTVPIQATYRCPVAGCSFGASSAAAHCSVHGRKVV